MKINMLRQIVDNGWTIKNRKNITNTIGSNEFNEICSLANKSRLGGDVFSYNCASEIISVNSVSKIKETLLKILNDHTPLKDAAIRYHCEPKGILAFGYPKEYTSLLSREFVEAKPERVKIFNGKQRILKAQPAHYEETYVLLPHYCIDELWGKGEGSGKSAVKGVVLTSLMNSETKGRVSLEACCIDGKTSPAGFYYKLGFRMLDPFCNEQLEQWVKNGGNRTNAPFLTGIMYLPKENILKCLTS